MTTTTIHRGPGRPRLYRDEKLRRLEAKLQQNKKREQKETTAQTAHQVPIVPIMPLNSTGRFPVIDLITENNRLQKAHIILKDGSAIDVFPNSSGVLSIKMPE